MKGDSAAVVSVFYFSHECMSMLYTVKYLPSCTRPVIGLRIHKPLSGGPEYQRFLRAKDA